MYKVQLRSHLKKKEAIRLTLMGLFSRSKTLEQPMNRSDINHALAVFGPVFKIFAEAAISAKPGKTALHDPAKRCDFKAFVVVAAQGDIDHDLLEFAADKVHKFASVAAIGPDTLQAFKHCLGQLLQ